MSPWWRKSSSKEAKKKGKNKAIGCGIFCLIRRKLKVPSESKQVSSQRRNEFFAEMGSNFQVSSPSTIAARSQNLDERPHSHPLPLPENVSDTGRVDSGKRASRNIESSKGSSQFVLPVPKSDRARSGLDRNAVGSGLVTDFTDSDGECNDPSGFWLLSPQECNYGTSTSSPSNVTYTTRKKREKRQVKACVDTQMMQTSPKQHPLSRHMANLQIPQSGGFFGALDSSKSSPCKSPMRVVVPEPALNDFWAMRPSANPGFLGQGPSSSPGSGQDSKSIVLPKR